MRSVGPSIRGSRAHRTACYVHFGFRHGGIQPRFQREASLGTQFENETLADHLTSSGFTSGRLGRRTFTSRAPNRKKTTRGLERDTEMLDSLDRLQSATGKTLDLRVMHACNHFTVSERTLLPCLRPLARIREPDFTRSLAVSRLARHTRLLLRTFCNMFSSPTCTRNVIKI